ncbi:Oxidoreductase domain protein [metagenome]|uniref:Oxidoreductase domain protein n=1 Tax=metagenome TaxID=256318 RepID=A0A2P2BZR2_9ZZZZ
MRFGLVGTGPWAHIAHGPGLLAAPAVELVGVWGRSLEKAQPLARELGVTAYADYAALLDEVDAVAFAVPPDIQATLALQAARAGKHLLLDKPIATSVEAAHALAAAVREHQVGSVVFFTDRFFADSRAWWAEVQRTGGWKGGWMRWFGALQTPGNPFGDSPWRHERGALWDTGPHALSNLITALGPVTTLQATAGEGDLVMLNLGHESGASSSITLTQFAPPAAEVVETTVWGDSGFSTMPPRPESAADLLAIAAGELIAAVESGQPHEVGVEFGARIVELIAEAQSQISSQLSSQLSSRR